MTTWGELLADMRADMKDTSATPKWSNALVFMYTKDAIRDYSRYFPVRVSSTLTLTGGSYPLPTNFVIDYTVQYGTGNYLERRNVAPGRRYSNLPKPTLYYIMGGQLYVNSDAADDSLILTYGAVHDLPADETDTTHVFTFQTADEELIRLYVKAKANEQIRGQQSGLDRFRLGSGNRSDNPLEPEVANLMDEYYMKISERMPSGAIRLYRPGRRR